MRKKPAGAATSDLVRSAHVGGNAELFASIASLYLRDGSRVADVTFGRGVFYFLVFTLPKGRAKMPRHAIKHPAAGSGPT